MSGGDQGPLLYLKLDEAQGSQVTDVSGVVGALGGSPQIVADDTFGACLSLGGDDDAVRVPSLALSGPNPPHTLAAWIWLDAYPAARGHGREWMLLLGQADGGAHHWLVDGDGSMKIGVWNGAQHAPRLPLGAWTHIAATYDGAQLTCYVNGQPFGAPLACGFNLSSTGLTLGRSGGGSVAGRLACVRAYGRALSHAEVQKARLADMSPAAAFQRAFPLGFRLYDDDDQPVLYITDLPSGVDTNLAISNTSPHAVELIAPESPQSGPDNHHFELRFRPGVLSSGARDQLAVAGGGWSLASAEQPDHTVSVYLLSAAARTIQPSDQLGLTLNHMSADGAAGARGTRVELRYQQLRPAGDSGTITGSRVQYLSIVNHRGQQSIPLHAGFAGANTVLNDGSDNTLRLRLTNTSPVNSLRFTSNSQPAPTALTISFDTSDTSVDWALANDSGVAAIAVAADQHVRLMVRGRLVPFGVRSVASSAGESPQWTITTPLDLVLQPGSYIEIAVTGVRTTYDDGQTNVYVRYENFAGYWDGQLIAVIEKTPIRPRAANDYQKGQFTLSGGGTVTWQGPGKRLKWTTRFIAISAERPHTFADGYADITMPAGPIPAANVYDGQDRAAGPDGVALNAWEALYAVHQTGGGYTQVSFRIVRYTNPFFAPSNWLLVALVNGDDGAIKLGTGVTLATNSASSRGSPVPSGAILMWYGAPENVPDGWALCDGRPGTPDLRDRFVVGAGGSTAPHATGGAASVSLTVDQMPSHGHSGAIQGNGAHSHTVPVEDRGRSTLASVNILRGAVPDYVEGGRLGDGRTKPHSVDEQATVFGDGSHSHTLSLGASGGGQPHENRPPYYALCFIMKL